MMWAVEGYYHEQYGWEEIDFGYSVKADAVDSKKTYDACEPQYPHRVVRSKENA